MTIVYGIKNCDKVKKAKKWLDSHAISYDFHDFKGQGIDATTVQSWIEKLGVEGIVNKRSTTWKQLDEKDRSEVTGGNAKITVALIIANPTLVKRPVLATEDHLFCGFDEAQYATIFQR